MVTAPLGAATAAVVPTDPLAATAQVAAVRPTMTVGPPATGRARVVAPPVSAARPTGVRRATGRRRAVSVRRPQIEPLGPRASEAATPVPRPVATGPIVRRRVIVARPPAGPVGTTGPARAGATRTARTVGRMPTVG
ncbi:hypothetical protein ASF78_21295 [Cellulomonas sp. Leaf334]|nr:hypothetical protein ASF78_21295 [Cellulomonas sp. Leaf334]